MYIYAYNICMGVEWDPGEAKSNKKKHGVSFADAATALYDESAVTVLDEDPTEEERFVTLGIDALGRLLVVVYTYREKNVRLISARKATAREKRAYEKGI